MRFLPIIPLLAALTAVSCQKKAEEAPKDAVIQKVDIATPLVKKVVEWDEFVGRLESPKMVHVRPRVGGYIEKIHFKEGAEVNQGDLLVSIDSRRFIAEVDTMRAEVDRHKTRVELAKNEAKRAETLIRSRAIAAEDHDTRLKALASAEATVRAAEAQVKKAELDVEFAVVRAPISGRISNAPVTEGNLVSGGDKDATLLTTIVALDPLYCYFEIDEQSALKYRKMHMEGKQTSAMFTSVQAEMGLANEQGFPRDGELDFVDNVLKPDTGTIRVRGVFPNKDKLMAPGFFARIRIPGSPEYEAILVRDEAIGSDQGRAFVFVVGADNIVEYRPVEIGPLHEGLRIVRSGLKANEKLVINGVVHVKNGTKVDPQVLSMELPKKETQTAKAP